MMSKAKNMLQKPTNAFQTLTKVITDFEVAETSEVMFCAKKTYFQISRTNFSHQFSHHAMRINDHPSFKAFEGATYPIASFLQLCYKIW